jgi:hypothetical protein
MKLRSPLTKALGSAAGAVPDFILAGLLLWIWLHPLQSKTFGVNWAQSLILLEFIIIHASGILGGLIEQPFARWKKIGMSFSLGAVYSVFAFFFGGWPGVQAFWILCFNRVLPVFTGRILSEEETREATSVYVTAAVFYLLAVIPSAIIYVPAFGVTPEVIKALAFTGDAPWNLEPQRIMAAGVLYYTLHALNKLYPAYEMMRGNKVS